MFIGMCLIKYSGIDHHLFHFNIQKKDKIYYILNCKNSVHPKTLAFSPCKPPQYSTCVDVHYEL